jgi:hypothetical protein
MHTIAQILSLFLGIQQVLAADISPDRPLVTNDTKSADSAITSTYDSIVSVLLVVASALAVLYVVWGGVRYIMSAGAAEKTKIARATILNALIGLGIVLLAYVIISFATVLGGSITNLTSSSASGTTAGTSVSGSSAGGSSAGGTTGGTTSGGTPGTTSSGGSAGGSSAGTTTKSPTGGSTAGTGTGPSGGTKTALGIAIGIAGLLAIAAFWVLK